MKFGFSPELDQRISTGLETLIATVNPPWHAAFDADGTLWDTDVGERFFRYQIENCGLKTFNGNPWDHYEEMKLKHYRDACAWLAQINKGQHIDQVRTWASHSVQTGDTIPTFLPQIRLIEWLLQKNIKVWIVTASVQWAVEPAAHLVGLTTNDVLGITTHIHNGIVSDKVTEPVTWREGKQKGLLQKTNGVAPILSVGNTTGDAFLLECSQGLRLAVCSASNTTGELAESERDLQVLAEQRGWMRHQFKSTT